MQDELSAHTPIARKKRKYTAKRSAEQLARDNNNTLDRYVCYKRSLISFVPEALLLNLLQADSQLLCVANFVSTNSDSVAQQKSHISAVHIKETEDLETVAWLHWNLHVPSLPSVKLCDCFVAACTIVSLPSCREKQCDLTDNNSVQIAAPYIGHAIHDNEFWCCVRCIARLACRTFAIVVFPNEKNSDHILAMLDQAYRSLSGIGYCVAIKINDESSCALVGASILEWSSDCFDSPVQKNAEQDKSNTVRLIEYYEQYVKPLF